MNERIKELYAQAIQYADSVVPANNRYNDIYYSIVSGKHAELMVMKCAEIGERYADGNYEVYNQIMAHFGLEEE